MSTINDVQCYHFGLGCHDTEGARWANRPDTLEYSQHAGARQVKPAHAVAAAHFASHCSTVALASSPLKGREGSGSVPAQRRPIRSDGKDLE